MLRRLLLVAGASLCLAAPAAAGVRIGGFDASGYPQIQATVVGTAPSDRAPTVTENGSAVAGLTAQNLGREKAVVLALDRSQSMAGAALANAKAAAQTFARVTSSADRLSIVAFGHAATTLTGLSAGGTEAAVALGGVTVDRRSGTALYDAVVLAASALESQPLPGRVIVLLSDGRDVSSSATLDEAIAAARGAHAGVYAIAAAGAGFDAAPLRRLAGSTGGTYHRVGSTAQLTRVYASIAQELARTWQVRFTTTSRPGDTLRLRVSVPSLGAAAGSYVVSATHGTGVVPPEAPSAAVPSVLYGNLGTLLVGIAVALIIALACALLFSSGSGTRLRARIDNHVAVPERAGTRRRSSGRRGIGRKVFRATERAFGNIRQFRALQQLLERADLPLRAGEFVYIQLGSAFVVGFFVAIVSRSLLLAFVGLAVGGFLPRAFAQFRARSRLKAFENQLPDLLITLAASLKAGHSFRHGIQTVVNEGHAPASDEFKRVLTDTSLGRPMDDALKDMSSRVGSKNLEFVIVAVTIQRQVGGSMAGLFDMVADAVRQRQQFARKIKGLTAMGRMSAYVLIALPIFLALVLTVMNAAYMAPLYHTSTGHMLLVLGFVMIVLGTVLLQKIVSFRG
jgi:tight adherence protein B